MLREDYRKENPAQRSNCDAASVAAGIDAVSELQKLRIYCPELQV